MSWWVMNSQAICLFPVFSHVGNVRPALYYLDGKFVFLQILKVSKAMTKYCSFSSKDTFRKKKTKTKLYFNLVWDCGFCTYTWQSILLWHFANYYCFPTQWPIFPSIVRYTVCHLLSGTHSYHLCDRIQRCLTHQIPTFQIKSSLEQSYVHTKTSPAVYSNSRWVVQRTQHS